MKYENTINNTAELLPNLYARAAADNVTELLDSFLSRHMARLDVAEMFEFNEMLDAKLAEAKSMLRKRIKYGETTEEE